jgi:hypothetical protein
VAARRLVIVMLVLLAISTLAAALLPPPEDEPPPATERPQERPQQPEAAEGAKQEGEGLLLVARLRLAGATPRVVQVERGDELRLDVLAPFGADLEIPGFGLTGTVTPSAPAHFDLLATRAGEFPIWIVGVRKPAARILVGRRGSGRCGVATPATPEGRATAPSCARPDKRGSKGSGRSARQP